MDNKTDFSNATIKIESSNSVELGNISIEKKEPKKKAPKKKEPIEEVTKHYLATSLAVKLIIMVSALAILATVVAFKL
jgi:hypothetical protein